MVEENISVTKADVVLGRAPLLIAHRGSSSYAPENTIAAFQRAIDDGADGIELDVRLAACGDAVVFHDRTLRRIAGRNTTIADLTADELAATDAGSWFNYAFPDRAREAYSLESVPSLRSVLEYIRDFSGTIYIELKCRKTEIGALTRKVADVLNGPEFPMERVTVKSFKLGAIPLVKALCPGIRTAALFAPKVLTILRKKRYLIDLAQQIGADEISIHYSLATRKLVRKATEAGLDTAIWTVDNPMWVKRAMKIGVRSIITNDPALLAERRHELGSG